MRIEIFYKESIISGECYIRALLFNDSFEPIVIQRNAFVGPNLKSQPPLPESVEATFGGLDEPLTLQPFTFYGRERTFNGFLSGKLEVSAYYKVYGQEEISTLECLYLNQQ